MKCMLDFKPNIVELGHTIGTKFMFYIMGVVCTNFDLIHQCGLTFV